MSDEILKYINKNIEKPLDSEEESTFEEKSIVELIIENIKGMRPKYNIAKSYDNSALYKIYKKLSVHELEILVSDTDRTTDIKERYEKAQPLDEYIKNHKEDFIELANKCTVEDIQKIEKMQEKFKNEIPYFVKYDKNYLWQIYYSDEDKKYFTLFPTKEGETAILFYLIMKKLQKEDTEIYVPICKEEYSENFLNKKETTDLENYIWIFTKNWPMVYEVNNNGIYIVGETKVQENLKTKYRIVLKNKEKAQEEYTLLKALFILTTETNYEYNFAPQLDDNGNIVFTYNNTPITIENLQDFINEQTSLRKELKKELNKQIEYGKEKIEKLKSKIAEQSKVYSTQEKQILMFLDCKKSFFKRIKFFLKSNKKLSIASKQILEQTSTTKEQTNSASNNFFENSKFEEETNSINFGTYTITDLVKICAETKKIITDNQNLKADIKALELKKQNLTLKIQNAEKYIDEIEEHKKSIFEFWKFANKDKLLELQDGKAEEEKFKVKTNFNFEEDLPQVLIKADEIQRRKLSNDECNALFISKFVLSSINSVTTKSDTYKIEEEYEQLKKNYSKKDNLLKIFGNMSDDYTIIKVLNNTQHRENKKNVYSILKLSENMSFEEFREMVKQYATLLNEAYTKITSVADMPLYYTSKIKGYTIGEMDPYKLFKDDSIEKIYKVNADENYHVLYYSNISVYDNYNKTLPIGMDESTEVLIRTGGNKKKAESNVNLLIEKDLFNAKVRKIKIIEEESL